MKPLNHLPFHSLPLRHSAALIKIIAFAWTFFPPLPPSSNQGSLKVPLPAASSTDWPSCSVKYSRFETGRSKFTNTQRNTFAPPKNTPDLCSKVTSVHLSRAAGGGGDRTRQGRLFFKKKKKKNAVLGFLKSIGHVTRTKRETDSSFQ